MKSIIRRGAEATATLMSGLQTAVPALLLLPVTPVLLLLLPLFPEAVRPVRSLANAERERVGAKLAVVVSSPYRRAEGGHRQRVRTVGRDPALWRDIAWLFTHGGTGTFGGLIAVALWPAVVSSVTLPLYWWQFPPGTFTAVLVPLWNWPQALTLPFAQAVLYAAAVYWLVPLGARGQLRMASSLLRTTERTSQSERIERLTRTRSEALESHGAELRRIERDLHDGTQAQLVSVAVRLGLLEHALTTDPATAQSLVREARSGVEESLTELRGVVRGIYPPILTDRGLVGAVHALAGGQHIPVDVRIPDGLSRPAAPIEAAAYFVIAESLTNVAKHSTADHAEVTVERVGTALRVRVHDNGQGGVDESGGSGVLGIRRRVAALDGTTRITSPADEGTTIEVLLPCE